MKYSQRLYYIWLLITNFFDYLFRNLIEKAKSWRVCKHIYNFWLIWLFFFVLLAITGAYCGAYCFFPNYTQIPWTVVKWTIYIIVFFIIALFIKKPLNAVYGMMGTSGSVNVFFGNFLFITLIFTCIYHWGFFHNARVSYDVNQPHVCYNYNDTLSANKKRETILEKEKTIILINLINKDSIILRDTIEQIQVAKIEQPIEPDYHYQEITFFQTFRNTILTTLMQEPADFFAIAATHNEAMDNDEKNLDGSKAATFHYLLIIQILISWIFFGVFISIIYNKFRYES